ncbi:juvenile hormone acid O-methyltransferase [Caerostris extrusa]|uniref:Juvenile hormone acid O-methyltransferase n=1 Tax=Caerostris extrusa TaxID=172846 RepID=A0AAV4SQ17_CAEEX|nr:juvenile hormone acid O-methyltransferase [Caerostris extrusa]
MDVGCGAGGTTAKLIFPLFTQSKKIFAVDFLPGMIDLAKRENSHPSIEYSVANIGDWSTVKQWEDQITKLVSVHCFEWVKDQKKCFQNVFKLLKKGGQAALCFGIDNYVSESHYKKYHASYYKQILEDIGFDIVYCKEEVKIDVFSSDEEYKIGYLNDDLDYEIFLINLCLDVLHSIPTKEEFQKDLFQELLKQNGRNKDGLPFHTANMIEIIIRK